MRSLANCHNIQQLRALARRNLPKPMFDYIDGGADDEWSMARNQRAFVDYQLIPNHLRNVDSIDLSTRVLGANISMPLLLAPTGMSGLFHHDKEFAVARAAERFNTLYSLSTMATTSLEEIASTTATPKMFQIYIHKDRGLTSEFVARCKTSGYHALCLTVDTPLAGNRERDLLNGMSMPPRFSLSSLLSFALHPYWTYHALIRGDFELANIKHRVDALGDGALSLIDYVNQQFDRSINWDDAAWLAEQWDGPFVIKGIQSVADARKAAAIGASAVMISNHGGRQLEYAAAPIDCLPAIRDALGDQLELIVDGGIRRGTDIIKAIAMGANACSIGRPYLYGLAAGGQAGVERALHLLQTELERSMALLGCRSLDELSAEQVQPVPNQR